MRISKVSAVAMLLVLAAPLPNAASSSEVPESYRAFPYAQLSGDLDGDGHPDTLSFGRTPPDQEIDDIGTIGGHDGVVTARSGRDGSLLWQVVGAETSSVLPAPVGPQGQAGALLVDGPRVRADGGSSIEGGGPPDVSSWPAVAADSLTLSALSGSGSTVWSRTLDPGAGAGLGAGFEQEAGQRVQAAAVAGVPMYVGTLQATPSPALDVLVMVADRIDASVAQVTRVRALVVDGATGAVTSPAERITTTRTTLRVAGDADGDGLDDIAFLRMPTQGGVSVVSGADGNTVWEQDADLLPGFGYFAEPLQDVTGDGRAELVTGGIDHMWENDEGQSAVLDGATGEVLVSGPLAAYTPAGDVDGDGAAEVLSQQVTQTPAPSLYADEVVYRLYSLDGSTLAERVYDGPTDDGMWLSLFPSAGDLDEDDGIADAAHEMVWDDDGQRRFTSVAVNGRTLEPQFEATAGIPLEASLDGRGDDLALVRLAGPGTVEVTAQDGITGEALWTTQVAADPRATSLLWPDLQATDLDGDDVPDVILNARLSWSEPTTGGSAGHSQTQVWALSGADGSLLWKVA
ncbi:MAG TPA: hypothetical protein VGB28_07190 [Actinomycetota bacterium]